MKKLTQPSDIIPNISCKFLQNPIGSFLKTQFHPPVLPGDLYSKYRAGSQISARQAGMTHKSCATRLAQQLLFESPI